MVGARWLPVRPVMRVEIEAYVCSDKSQRRHARVTAAAALRGTGSATQMRRPGAQVPATRLNSQKYTPDRFSHRRLDRQIEKMIQRLFTKATR